MEKAFLLLTLLLLSAIPSTHQIDLQVNHNQVVTPITPNISHPIVQPTDNVTVHNPENISTTGLT